MGDSEIGGGVSSAMSGAMLAILFKPNPSINILKVWEGIVEIALRIASLVLLFILFICACAALSNVNFIIIGNAGIESLRQTTNAAAGWILFVTIIALVLEGVIVAGRFLNFGFVTKYALIVHIVDICISFGLAVAIFCGAIALGVYSGQWGRIVSNLNFSSVVSSSGATAAFGFFTLFVFVGLGVWMILSLVLKWRNQTAYSASSGGGDQYAGGDED